MAYKADSSSLTAVGGLVEGDVAHPFEEIKIFGDSFGNDGDFGIIEIGFDSRLAPQGLPGVSCVDPADR